MIISGMDVFSLRAPLIYPFRTALGQHDDLENLLLRVRTRDGNEGWGEAAIAPHITGESVKGTRAHLEGVAQKLIGKDTRHYAQIAEWLREKLPQNKAALAAVEMGVLDVLCKSRLKPLWRLFGRSAVKLNTDITIVIADLAKTRLAARRFYRQGFRTFKIKIGREPDLDFQRVLCVRGEAPDAVLYLDANQGYTAKQAISFLKELKKCRVYPALLEQPVPREDWDGLARIRSEKLTLVCADESARSLADCRRLIKHKAVDVINIKLMKSGFQESRRIVSLAKAQGVKLMIGGMMESVLAMTAAAHFAAGLGGFDFIDLDPPFFIRGAWGRSPYLSASGTYDLRHVEAGIGLNGRVKER